jgi:glycosyltransferase involved in cell wall biosynthesis
MNLLFICEYQVDENQGGVQRVTSILTKYFLSKNLEVFNLFFRFNNNSKCKINDNEYKFFDNNILDIKNINLINKVTNDNKIDIIINQMGFNQKILKAILKSEFRNPILSCLHSDPFFELKYAKIELFNNLNFKNTPLNNFKIIFKPFYLFVLERRISKKLKFIYKNSSKVILLANNFKSNIKKMYPFINGSKSIVIPNPIDPKFNRNKKRIFNDKQILYVGRLNKGKRVDLILHIWKQLELKHNDWEMTIVGDGPQRLSLIQLSEKLNLKKINFIGHSNNVNDFYNKSSIFLSTSAFEGLPLTLLEAQYYGLVPIAYNTYDSIYDVIKNNISGFIIPELNEKLFVSKLKKIITNEQLRENMSIKAMNFAQENFNIRLIGETWLSLLKDQNKR